MTKKIDAQEAKKRAIIAANEIGASFVGFSEGEYRGAKCKVLLSCNRHGLMEKSYDNLMSGGGCKLCANDRLSSMKRTHDSEIIIEISKACEEMGWEFVGFVGGKFTTVDGMATVLCHKHGEFSRRIADIKSRNYLCPSCRREAMRERNRMSESDAISRWKDACDAKGFSFVGFVGEYVSADSTKATIECKNHGQWNASYSNFVLSGCGCSSCSKVGFKFNGKAFVYALVGNGAIKIGVSNNPDKRIKALSKNTPFEFSVFDIKEFKLGSTAMSIEREFHKSFESAGFSGFDGSTEWLKFDDRILEKMRSI